MKRLLHNVLAFALVAVLSLSFVGCNNDDTPEPKPHTQTLIFYFAGTDLSLYFYKNISAIKEALRQDIKGKSRVMLFFQQSEKNSAEIIELIYRNGMCEEKKLATHDLPARMDTENLSYFLNEIMRLAPADSYSLIIGSHGLGWIPIGARPNDTTLSLRSTASQEDFWQQTGGMKTRFIGEESNVQNAFDISTLSAALNLTGKKMEYILFDACFMANVESAYVLRNNTKYIVGSVCEIMGDGFPYTNIMPHLLTNNGQGYDLDLACQEFNTFYKSRYGYSGSISIIDCSGLDALATEMKKVNQGLRLEYVLNNLQFYEGQKQHVFFDLGDYVSHYCGDEELKADFKTQLDRTVIKRYTLNKFYSAYGSFGTTYNIDVAAYSGINTSAPAQVYQYYYEQTDWYRATH